METALTLLLCALPLGAFVALVGYRWRFRWLALGIYCLIYLPLSLRGQFLTANHGGMDWQDHWAPRGLVEASKRRSGRSNVQLSWAGTLFWPLVVLDNILWHRTHSSDLSQ